MRMPFFYNDEDYGMKETAPKLWGTYSLSAWIRKQGAVFLLLSPETSEVRLDFWFSPLAFSSHMEKAVISSKGWGDGNSAPQTSHIPIFPFRQVTEQNPIKELLLVCVSVCVCVCVSVCTSTSSLLPLSSRIARQTPGQWFSNLPHSSTLINLLSER